MENCQVITYHTLNEKMYGKDKIKILVTYFHLPPYVKSDIELLKKHFNVSLLKYEGIKKLPKFLFELLMNIPKNDVVFTRFASTHAFFSVLFSKIFRKRSIVVVAGFDVANIPEINYGFARSRISRAILKFILNNADKVLPVAKSLKEDAIKNTGVSGDNFCVIHNGYDPEKWKPSGEKENMVLTVCDDLTELVIKRKGIRTFVEAARYIQEAKFIVIGRRIEESKELKNAPKNVKFVDFMPQEELLRYYQRAKVYCQLSRYEGHPNALSEAMLCECVPVGTKHGGIPEVIGDTGFYVPYGDAKATAEAIKNALKSDNGKAARERIKTSFTLEKREKKLVKIIVKLSCEEIYDV